MSKPSKHYALLTLLTLLTVVGQARDVKDTIFSTAGDRVIVNYTISQSGQQMTVKFNGVQKKLSKSHQEKYRKLDEIAVVMFDRTGNYHDMKFEGMATEAFMVPSNLSYSRSEDGYFLLQDAPSLSFSITQGNKAQLAVPLYLAHYEKKHRYRVIARCGTLQLSASARAGRAPGSAGSVGQDGVREETITSTEELAGEAISPAEEASIRISSIRSMLDKATRLPLSEELTHEAEMLRELRFKVTDGAVKGQIGEVLEAYENKKQELQAQADASQAGAQAAKDSEARAEQARQDSIAAQQALQAAKDKKDLIWLVLGVVGLIGAYKIASQVYQNWSIKKMQRKMMDSVNKMASPATKNPLDELTKVTKGSANPLGRTVARGQQEAEKKVKTAAQREAEAAKKKLMEKLGRKASPGGGNKNISI